MNQEYVGCVLWGDAAGRDHANRSIHFGFIEILIGIRRFKGIAQRKTQAVFCCRNGFTYG